MLARADARVHKTQIDLDLAPCLPPVWGDRVQLQQMVLTLVRNAIEALTRSSSGARRILIRTGRYRDTHLELSVCDNGPGVALEMVDRLFMPFATTKPTGTGLGLAMSQTIARSHGGTIGHRPAEPCGAFFYVRLPVTEDHA